MVHGNALNSYQKAQVYDEMDPNKLILMLYDGAIRRIILARDGLNEENPQKRGENLGKAIAIIAELNACLDENIKTEEIAFLRGLYRAMLTELPKVSVTKDVLILDRAEKYLNELKKIWVTTVVNSSQDSKADANKGTTNPAGAYTNTGTGSVSYQRGSVAI